MAEDNVDFAKVVRMAREFSRPYRVANGSRFKLSDVDPGDTATSTARTSRAPRRRWQSGAQRAGGAAGHALRAGSLVGAAGVPGHGRGRQRRRDQARHVRRQSAGLPGYLVQGALHARSSITITSGAARSNLPERGRIGIFNRSLLRGSARGAGPSRVPRERRSCRLSCVGKHIWNERYRGHPQLRALPRRATARSSASSSCTCRATSRRSASWSASSSPEKNWKFSAADVRERGHWDDYMDAYEDMIRDTATKHAPWYVVPADNKWFTRIVVAAAIIEALASLDLTIRRSTRSSARTSRRRACRCSRRSASARAGDESGATGASPSMTGGLRPARARGCPVACARRRPACTFVVRARCKRCDRAFAVTIEGTARVPP